MRRFPESVRRRDRQSWWVSHVPGAEEVLEPARERHFRVQLAAFQRLPLSWYSFTTVSGSLTHAWVPSEVRASLLPAGGRA